MTVSVGDVVVVEGHHCERARWYFSEDSQFRKRLSVHDGVGREAEDRQQTGLDVKPCTAVEASRLVLDGWRRR